MKTKKTISNLVAAAILAVASILPGFAQFSENTLGVSCGCPPISSRPTVDVSTLADAAGNLTAVNTILTCQKKWRLDKRIFVGKGKTITIQPGTAIFGKEKIAGPPVVNGGTLIVSRGGKIFAPGTETCPIIFTGDQDLLDGNYGLDQRNKWGGVILLGVAPNNLIPSNGLSLGIPYSGVGFIEGFSTAEPRIYFGANPIDTLFPQLPDPDDNSGIMTYVSIRHGGEIFEAGKEINGLTLGSVGRGTTIHHVEVVANADDGFEMFGGTVDLKYCSVLFSDDDGFDFDLGYSGRGQFLCVIKAPDNVSNQGDNGFECDTDDDFKYNSSNPSVFLSTPTFYNCTIIGSKNQNGVATQTSSCNAIQAKEATAGTIRNCVFANFKTGVNFQKDVKNRAVSDNDAYDNWINGSLKVECNTFMNVDSFLTKKVTHATSGDPFVAVINATDSSKLTTDGNVIVPSISGFSNLYTITFTGPSSVTTALDLIPQANIASTCTVAPNDGFFSPAPFRGAFEAGKKSWLSYYTLESLYSIEKGLKSCPTDINTDGTTNTTDFLQLLGAFGTNCN